MRQLIAATIAVAALVAAAPASAAHPATIRLPDGFQPEGIAAGASQSLYVGSISTGAIWRGDARTGTGSVLAQGQSGRSAIGIEVYGGRIFVAGGATGMLRVQDSATGADVVQHRVATPGTTFINDVAVTPQAAWFTDSRQAAVYALGRAGEPPIRVALSGDLVMQEGNNLNGIVAVGSRLVAVQSNTGKLFDIDPRTGATDEIDLGGQTLLNGDGMFNRGRTIWVVQNRLNQVVELQLSKDGRSASLVRTIREGAFDVPTTIAPAGGFLWAVNARFGITAPATARFDVVRTDLPAATKRKLFPPKKRTGSS
ncbi:SMP-30/gluconolactonase/LRE family protein [Conexibacter sp. SYSU D00693]|uniref:SMP-30/gluconolactonase/LRE family protein n=1 Tax=Conexibacter sp. SYSU D00693 TaxID=2812560 RepID=UPI00196A3716|nr:hypothetical protein [Conexibacter sp. SYSU D00693]